MAIIKAGTHNDVYSVILLECRVLNTLIATMEAVVVFALCE